MTSAEQMRVWRSNNRERWLATQRRWRARHPDKKKAEQQRRAWRLAGRRLLLLQELGGRCIDCGNDNPLVLEFDHRDPALKLRDVLKCFSMASMRSEAAKCDIRCANCHRVKTWYARESGGGRNRRTTEV